MQTEITIEELDALLARNFADHVDPITAVRYGYVRKLVMQSMEAKGLLSSLVVFAPQDNLKIGYVAFVAGLMSGLMLAEKRTAQ